MDKNLAYDLSKYENAAEKPVREEKPISVHQAKPAPSGSATRVFLLTAIAGLLLGLVIYAKVQNAMIYSEISEMTRYVDVLHSENVRMQTEIESKSALRSVEDYAEDVLGMQKLDKSQIEYLTMDNGNMIDIPEASDNLFVKLKHAFEDFVEYLRG